MKTKQMTPKKSLKIVFFHFRPLHGENAILKIFFNFFQFLKKTFSTIQTLTRAVSQFLRCFFSNVWKHLLQVQMGCEGCSGLPLYSVPSPVHCGSVFSNSSHCFIFRSTRTSQTTFVHPSILMKQARIARLEDAIAVQKNADKARRVTRSVQNQFYFHSFCVIKHFYSSTLPLKLPKIATIYQKIAEFAQKKLTRVATGCQKMPKVS